MAVQHIAKPAVSEETEGVIPDWAREGLSEESQRCLDNLARYEAPEIPE
jgi:hypothetical protein